MFISFKFDERKALEALAFIARKSPGLTTLYVAKIFFYAEKWHINKYARPIVADVFKAMSKGPVPSTIKNFIDANWQWVDKPDLIDAAICVSRSGWLSEVYAGNAEFSSEHLSPSDLECLEEAILFCKDKAPEELSNLTHFEKSWMSVPTNAPMNYIDFVDDDNDAREEIIEQLIENAAYGVL